MKYHDINKTENSNSKRIETMQGKENQPPAPNSIYMLRDKREDTASENQGQIALKNNKLRNKKYLRKKKKEKEEKRRYLENWNVSSGKSPRK